MEPRRIPDNDSIFRQCVYPVAFKKRNNFDLKNFLHLCHNGNTIVTSVAWERFVPTTDYVHQYGCRLAAKRNATAQANGGFDEKKRQVYCGPYEFKVSTVRSLATNGQLREIRFADVIHKIEEDEIAHANLIIGLSGSELDDIEGTKTAIIDRLWNAAHGPLTYVCECDDSMHHPSTYLTPAPAGPYRDTRHRIVRLWFVIRFRVLDWLLNKSVKISWFSV